MTPRRLRFRVVAPVFVLVLLAGFQAGAGASEPGLQAQVSDAIDMDRVRADLVALQRIADQHGGNRAAGTTGYVASVQHVRRQLTRAGYRADILSFPFTTYTELVERGRQVSPRRRSFRVEALDYSPSTSQRGIRGRVVAADDGCEPTDFIGVRGRIALVRRGACFTAQKAQIAGQLGASALVVYNTEPGPLNATLGGPGLAPIPVAAVEASAARSFRQGQVVIELTIRAHSKRTTQKNVVADTRPGAGRVLMIGGHLDSVREGPGINDNGTGVAVVLEIARVLKRVAPQRPVRFGFWGAEEFGLFGSTAYARSANAGDIAGYLNFDMLGSDVSPRVREVYAGPYAARWLGYFQSRGLQAEIIDLGGRSDHAPFAARGIPTGGLFAGIPRCYHVACDRVSSVDFVLLRELAEAAAFGVAEFAPSG
jgi:Zn-dependent M28 family amino/carboxypeptidase